MSAYLTTIAQAEEFYKRCKEQKADTFEERLAILKQMEKERRVFERTEAQVRKILSGKKVLKINNGKNVLRPKLP